MFDKMRQGHRLLLSSSKAAWLCGEMNADAHRSQSGEFDSCLERSKRNRLCLHMILLWMCDIDDSDTVHENEAKTFFGESKKVLISG